MSIAIVDTGVTGLNDKVQTGIAIKICGKAKKHFIEPDFSDPHGHGTDVACILSALCPGSTFTAVRIVQQCLSNTSALIPELALALGISWCIDNQIRLVNISYSIEKVSNDGSLATVCRRAAKNNVILVAAYRNAFQKPVYPAAFPSVIGVSIRRDLDHAQIAIVSEKNHDVAAFGGPYQITLPGNESKIVNGTSFATAQVTGMVARMLAIKPTLTLKQVFHYLKKYATE
jgi:subtilisin